MNKYHLKVIASGLPCMDVVVEAKTLITTQGAYMFHSQYDKPDSGENILVACYPVGYTIISKVEREGM